MFTPHDDLRALIAPDINAWSIRIGFLTPPEDRRQRPLGPLSDFVCEKIGVYNDLIREGILAPQLLWDGVMEAAEEIPTLMAERYLLEGPVSTRRLALLDLAWAERSLNIAFGGAEAYRARRDASPFFRYARELAQAEGRHPLLSWSDIAIEHPMIDPRSFLTKGEDRDQEILMYRIQSSMERVHKQMLSTAAAGVPDRDFKEWLQETVDGLDLILLAMVHLSRVRRVGQFYKLDPFLGEQGVAERGHGTGAFSVWTFLAGAFLSGNHNYVERLRDPKNHMAFDRDGDDLVTRLDDGRFQGLSQLIASRPLGPEARQELEAMMEIAQKKFAQFTLTHRGAMKKHSAASFDVSAPSMPHLTNKRAIDDAIADATPASQGRNHTRSQSPASEEAQAS